LTTLDGITSITCRRIIIITRNSHIQTSKNTIAYISSTFTTVITTAALIYMVASRCRSTEVTSTVITIITFYRNIHRSIHASFSTVAIIMCTLVTVVAINRSILTTSTWDAIVSSACIVIVAADRSVTASALRITRI